MKLTISIELKPNDVKDKKVSEMELKIQKAKIRSGKAFQN